MKTLFNPTKSFRFSFLLVFALISLASCKKSDDPTPSNELSAHITGTYTFTEVVRDGQTYPIGTLNLSGTITVERESETAVKYSLNLKNGNQPASNVVVTNVMLTDVGDNEVDMLKDGLIIGGGGNGSIGIRGANADGSTYVLIGEK